MAENTTIQTDNARQISWEDLESEYQATLDRIASIEKSLQSDVRTGIKVIQEFLSDTINAPVQDKALCVHMLDANMSRDTNESIHRLNVCYLALALGNVMGLSRMQLGELGTAAILHDIGKTEIPLQVMLQHPAQGPTEKQYLELHPQYGAEILTKDNNVSKNVVDAIYQHHEKCDGTGYPRKRTAQNISILAKIIAVVNTYDNLCNRYYLKKLLTPHESVSYLYTRLGDSLSMDVIKTFVKTIGVYPPGSLVELSDGHMGLVLATNSAQSNRPTIILYDKATPREHPVIINLCEAAGLTIVRSMQPSELSAEVVSYLWPGHMMGLFLGSLTATPPTVPAEVAEESDPAAWERRTTYRVKPVVNNGLDIFFQEKEAKVVNISIYGVCISHDKDYILKPQETVTVAISIDGQKFDVKGLVTRTWSTQSDRGLEHFASLQFLSQAAMRESLLNKKIMRLERQSNPENFERRMSFRVKPTLSSGLKILFQGAEADIVDISVGGACITKSKEFFLKSQETVSMVIGIDGQRFDVRSKVIRAWSAKSEQGVKYFLSLQFLSHPAMRESLLGRKIMLLERERFLNKIE